VATRRLAKPHPVQGEQGPSRGCPPRARVAAKRDGHPRQNPAYRPANEKPRLRGFSIGGPVSLRADDDLERRSASPHVSEALAAALGLRLEPDTVVAHRDEALEPAAADLHPGTSHVGVTAGSAPASSIEAWGDSATRYCASRRGSPARHVRVPRRARARARTTGSPARSRPAVRVRTCGALSARELEVLLLLGKLGVSSLRDALERLRSARV